MCHVSNISSLTFQFPDAPQFKNVPARASINHRFIRPKGSVNNIVSNNRWTIIRSNWGGGAAFPQSYGDRTYYARHVLLHNIRKIDVNIRNCRSAGERGLPFYGILFTTYGSPAFYFAFTSCATLERLRAPLLMRTSAGQEEAEDGGWLRSRRYRVCSLRNFRLPCFPNSVKVSHVRT